MPVKKKKIYAIVDLETTGGRPGTDRITEVAIALYDGETILETYETLINPERSIPYNITQITGITQEMVEDAPYFYEVAKKIVQMTEGAIFVAHNVRFDYGFLKAEFKQLGFTFTRRQLCTVRLSRKFLPGFRSYSLGNLIKELDIKVERRHRAMDDVLATVKVLDTIVKKEDKETIDAILNMGVRESLLPKNITMDILHSLPEECGVYYFYNKNKDVVYVGKSINIRKRVMQHFSKQTRKAEKLQKHVESISYQTTGSELIALLFESSEIKRLQPPINRAQRNRRFPFVVHSYKNQEGYTCFAASRDAANLNVVERYRTQMVANAYLAHHTSEYHLCKKINNLEYTPGACFGHRISECFGACIQAELPEDYNARAEEAREAMQVVLPEDMFIVDKGRSPKEKSIILIEDGKFQGYGYLETEQTIGTADEMRDVIQTYPCNPEVKRIIRTYIHQHPDIQKILI